MSVILESRTIRIDPAKCRGHMSCMRVCPAEAIRVWDGRAQLLPGRCIDCGLCLRLCKSGAMTARQDLMPDLKRFRHRVAIPSPALYAQFGRDVPPARIIAALKTLGFDEVADMSPAIEAVLLELRRQASEGAKAKPLISPLCPTVVRMVQVRFPDLVPLLAAVESPQEVMAEAIRSHRSAVLGLRRDQIGIVYITPCPAKIADLRFLTHHESSRLDGTVAISEIYGQIKHALSDLPEPKAIQNGVSGPCLNWALIGGQGGAMEFDNSIAVGGLENVIRTLEDIEDGELQDVAYVEFRSCREGCVDGCLTIDNLYKARSKLIDLIRRLGAEIDPDRPAIRDLVSHAGSLTGKRVEPRPPQRLDPDRATAILKMQRMEDLCRRLPLIDCGACGAPTCRAFAEDVVQGRQGESQCQFLLQEELRRSVADLSAILAKMPKQDRGGTEDKR